MDLVKESLGSEGSVSLKVSDGKLLITLEHTHASGKLSLVAEEDASYFLDKLAAAIPGQIDDAVLAVIKGALKVV